MVSLIFVVYVPLHSQFEWLIYVLNIFLLHRFWEMLAYFANTLIFFLVGVVIAVKTLDIITVKDFVLILSLYCGLTVIRLVIITVLYKSHASPKCNYQHRYEISN